MQNIKNVSKEKSKNFNKVITALVSAPILLF